MTHAKWLYYINYLRTQIDSWTASNTTHWNYLLILYHTHIYETHHCHFLLQIHSAQWYFIFHSPLTFVRSVFTLLLTRSSSIYLLLYPSTHTSLHTQNVLSKLSLTLYATRIISCFSVSNSLALLLFPPVVCFFHLA